MSAPDVLAVMDDARDVLTALGSPGTANGVAEARAAVAELIEAAKQAIRMDAGIDDRNRLRAALARVGGAK